MGFLKFVFLIASILIAIDIGLSLATKSFEAIYSEAQKHEGYDDTIRYIQELSSQGTNNHTSSIMLDGFTRATDFVKISADEAIEGIKKVYDSMNKTTPEVLVQMLTTTFARAYMDIVYSGAKSYFTVGILSQITHAKEGLNNASQLITNNGEVSVTGYNAARDIAIEGVKSGYDALPQGLLAGVKAVSSTETLIYKIIKQTTKAIFDAISSDSSQSDETSKHSNETTPVKKTNAIQVLRDGLIGLKLFITSDETSPKIQMLENEADQRYSKCQIAVSLIEESAAKHSNETTSVIKKYAIQVLRDGLIEGLKNIALADPIYKALDESLAIQNKDQAIAFLRKSFVNCKDQFVVAISIIQQTLGRIIEIVGPEIEVPLLQSMILVEAGRVALLNGVQNSLQIAIQGIEKDDAVNAMATAHEVIKTAGFSAYTQTVKSAKYAMDTVILA